LLETITGHFEAKDFLKIIDYFSRVSRKMIFSVPSDVYKNKDFGNEILRSKQTMFSLLQKNISFKFKVSNYFDLGIRTKIQLIKQDKLSPIDSLFLIFFKSCHLLVEIYYE